MQDTVNRHVIQDSGLFTLMFGAGKGQAQTLESLTEWQDKLIAFVSRTISAVPASRAGLSESAGREGSVVLPGADEETAG